MGFLIEKGAANNPLHIGITKLTEHKNSWDLTIKTMTSQQRWRKMMVSRGIIPNWPSLSELLLFSHNKK